MQQKLVARGLVPGESSCRALPARALVWTRRGRQLARGNMEARRQALSAIFERPIKYRIIREKLCDGVHAEGQGLYGANFEEQGACTCRILVPGISGLSFYLMCLKLLP